MRLTKTWARFGRAKEHREAFGRIWNDFLTGGDPLVAGHAIVEAAQTEHEPYFASVAVDDDGHGVISVEPVDLPARELALELGEMLYQLRAALDSLVYECAIALSGQDPPPGADRLEFPIHSSERAFTNSPQKIAPLGTHHKLWIWQIQPLRDDYETEGLALTSEVLRTINDLARKDRHRGLRVVGSWASEAAPLLDLPSGCSIEWMEVNDGGLLEANDIIARFQLRGWSPRSPPIRANPNCMIDVALEDLPPPSDSEDTLFWRTGTWLAVVKLLIEGFEESLNGDPSDV
ncbi:MAG: hypothetical protein V9E83_09290 [Baekduia sp.]